MATTLQTVARNASCNAIVDLVDTATPGNIALKSAGGTVIAVIDCAATAFGAASNGAAALAGTPRAGAGVAAAGAGTAAASFVFRDGNDAELWGGTVTATGGGGDMTIDNVNIANEQVVNVTGYTFTVPAS